MSDKFTDVAQWIVGILIVIGVIYYNINKQDEPKENKYELSASTTSDENEYNSSQSSQIDSYDTTTQHHQDYIRESKRKAALSTECKFDMAYKTALKFLDKKSLTLVRESNNRQENPDNCSVSYGFYVRLNEYNSVTQEMELSDKVYLVSMHLTKYNDFYSVELADLIDEVNMKQRSLL